MIPIVVQDNQGRVALLLRLTPRSNKAVFIDCEDCVRRVREIPMMEFKKNWKPKVYPIEQLCKKWLENQFIQITQNARKELIMLIKNVEVNSPEEIVDAFTGKEIADIYNEIFDGHMDRARDKQKVAGQIFDHLSTKLEKTEAPKIDLSGKIKTGAREKIRQLFSVTGVKYTLAQIIELSGGTETTVKSTLSQLKNPKYAGKNTVDIKKEGDTYYA